MPSQFFGLNIAYTGLLANNAALNTTSNNIANVHTEGYSRQRVSQQAANALRVFQTYGCAGAGVETLAIERIRDEFYDGRFWDNHAKVGEYSMKQYYMMQIENYFDDNGENAGFKSVFDQLMTGALQELLKDPSGAAAKTQFVGSAGALAEYFNGVAGNLQKLQKDINQEIKLKVDEINSLAGEIASLNKQINTIELNGSMANELRDRRALLVDQLSEIVDVDVKEIPVVDPFNPERETGSHRFMIKIAGGQMLVDGNDYNGLECVARKSYERVNQTDIDGLYDVYWKDGQRFNLNNPAMGGALKGLAELRDGNNGENFQGLVTATGVTKDGRNDTVTIQVGRAYLQDMNKCNLSHTGGKITLGNQEFYYDSWSYEISFDDEGNEIYSYQFVLSDREKNPARLTNDRVGKNASIGSSLDYQGIPYYMNQMNEWVRTFAQKFNDILTAGYDAAGNPGIKMFTGDMATSDGQFEFPDEFRYALFLQGRELLKLIYDRAAENLALEDDARPIYDRKMADTAKYDADVESLASEKQAAMEAEALDRKVAAEMDKSSVLDEIERRTEVLRKADSSLTYKAAKAKVRAEVEEELRTGTNGKTKITLTDDEKSAIEEEAQQAAKTEVESRYWKEALQEAKEIIQDAGDWDFDFAAAKEKVFTGTPEGIAALEQAIAEIARENGFPETVLKGLSEMIRKTIQDESTAGSDPDYDDILNRALNGMKFSVDVTDDSYYRLTAENFSILAAMELDPSRLANRYDAGGGVEQSDLLKDLKDLATNKDKMSFRGSSASEFLQCVQADVALNAQRANTFYASYSDVAGIIDTQRISISGVDEDEEAVNLVKYQNGYNLAAKMIQILTEVYDRLILETGV